MSRDLDDLDRELVHLLQLSPRISWTDAGHVLGLSATAVAARWRRLVDQGTAWIALQPNTTGPHHVTAIVELTCEPAARAEVAAHLIEDRRVLSIEESSRGGDLVLTVVVADPGRLSAFLLDDLPMRAGVTSLRPSVVVQTLSTGSDWRVGALSERQRAEAERLGVRTPGERPERVRGVPDSPQELTPDLIQLLAVLVREPRASFAELARDTGQAPASVRRRMHALTTGDRVLFRCDVAHVDFGLPITSAYFAQVAPADLPRTIAALRSMPTLRMCLQVTGEHNLIFSMLSPSFDGVAALQATIGRHLPWVRITESRLILRTRKRMGWVLDDDGRPTGRVVPPLVFD